MWAVWASPTERTRLIGIVMIGMSNKSCSTQNKSHTFINSNKEKTQTDIQLLGPRNLIEPHHKLKNTKTIWAMCNEGQG